MKKKFTMEDYYAQLEEVRQRHRQAVAPGSTESPRSATPMDRIRQAVLKNRPKVPKVL